MSIKAGSILTVAGRNVVDRLQSAGLGDARIPIETIREIGNDLVVDKVPGEPDFTFTMEGLDTSVEVMALLHGQIGTGTDPDTGYAGAADPDGTEYRWEDCQPLNIVSPWKRNTGAAGGNINAGLIIPSYFPTRISYRFGVTDNAGQTVDLSGGSYYYADGVAPVEETAVGDAIQSAFVTSENARSLRLGGPGGTAFQRVFGVLVGGRYQTRGVDYVESVPGGTVGAASAITTITFVTPPAVGELVRFVYFTETAKAYPQAVNADAIVKPGAVRGRNIVVLVGPDGSQLRLPGVQSVELTGTYEGEVEREMGNPEPTGRSVTGVDTTGTVGLRPRDKDAFFAALSEVTGVDRAEVFGYFNDESVPLEIQIQNPKNPAEILKTLYVEQAKFQPPGTPARVNAATDFNFQFDSVTGSFSEFKGSRL